MADLNYIACCGLVCANCPRFRKEKCPGCRVKAGFARCPIRACAIEKDLSSCGGCETHFMDCKKVNGVISAVFRIVFRSDRRKNLAAIKEHGLEKFLAEEMDFAKDKNYRLPKRESQ